MDPTTLLPEVITHWPVVVVAAILTVFGRVADRIFTRDNAYVFGSNGAPLRPNGLWFIARETLPLHPIAAGFAVGVVMALAHVSPEPGVSGLLTVCYFSGSGVMGLCGWVYLKSRSKAFPLPGESTPPAAGDAP